MKTKNVITKTVVAVAALCIGIVACKKDKNVVINDGGNKIISKYASFSKFTKTMGPAAQKFKLNLTTGGTIVGDHGYRFYFAPGSLINQSGMTVTGLVDIVLTEVTNVAEMLGSGARTEAFNGILGSAGMFNLQLSQGGAELYINPAKPVKAEVMADPNVNMDGVKLFEGVETTDTLKDTTVKWRGLDSVNVKINYDSLKQVWDSIQKAYLQKRCIKFDLYFASWCNLDAYYNSPSGQSIDIVASGTSGSTETRVFLSIKERSLKAFYEVRNWGSTDPEKYSCSPYNLPIGWKIRIIVVTRTSAGEVKYAYKDIVNATGAVHTFSSYTTISDADLEAFFKAE